LCKNNVVYRSIVILFALACMHRFVDVLHCFCLDSQIKFDPSWFSHKQNCLTSLLFARAQLKI